MQHKIKTKHDGLAQVTEDLKKLGFSILAVYLVLQAVYYKENFLNVIKMVLSVFWLFSIPGMSLLYYWKGRMDFLEHIILGSIVGVGAIGAMVYLGGFVGFPVAYEPYVFPPICIVLGILAYFKREDGE